MTSPQGDGGGGTLYSLRAVLDKQPIQITQAIVAIVNFACIMGWISPTADQRSALNLALLPVLGLFVASKTTNTRVLREIENGS